MTSGIPATHRNSFQFRSPLRAGGKGRYQHHPAPTETLLGGGQTDVFELGDLSDFPTFDVVEQHDGPGILQFFPSRCPLHYYGRVDGVRIVLPVLFDFFHQYLVV